MMTTRVEPRVQFIDEVMNIMANGRLVMPDFQRKYVWRNEHILELFDSIYKGYPIGSVLIWNPDHSLQLNASNYIIDNFIDVHREASYLIDGQQRLTTFYMCLYSQERHADSKWNVYFDLKSEKFLHLNKSNSNSKPHYFELRKVRSTKAFLDESVRISKETNDDQLISRAQNLVDKITKYRLAVTELWGGTVEQAIEIFTRLNREGLRVSEIDYVRALSKKVGSDALDELLTKSEHLIDKYQFNVKDGRNFNLKIIQAAFRFPVYGDKNSWKQVAMRINQLNNLKVIDKFITSLEKTILFSKNELKLNSISQYPYITQFYMLFCYFFENAIHDYEQLKTEFYYSALHGIPQTNPSTTEKLIEYYRNGFVYTDEINHLYEQYIYSPTPKLDDKFNASSASSKLLFNIIINNQLNSKKNNNINIDDFIYPPKNKMRSKELSSLLGNKLFHLDSDYKNKSIEDLSKYYKSLYSDFHKKITNKFKKLHDIP